MFGRRKKPLTRESYLAKPLGHEKKLLRLLGGRAGLTVLDIGSCDGLDAIRYARMFPGARVIAFEPLPANQDTIRRNLQDFAHQNIEVVPVALARTRGRARFHVSSGAPPSASPDGEWNYGNKSSSLLSPALHTEKVPWVKFEEVVEVDTDTLHNVCVDKAIERIDFAHMDVQGAELEVLSGAGEWLKRLGVVWMEVSRAPLYAGQPLKKDVEQFMKTHGFRLVLDDVGRVSGDQLWAHARLHPR